MLGFRLKKIIQKQDWRRTKINALLLYETIYNDISVGMAEKISSLKVC